MRQISAYWYCLAVAGWFGLSQSPLAASGQKAFSQADAQLPFEQKLDFTVGRALFEKLWVTAPSTTQISDGLGPLYNARSCASCHINNGRGHPPAADDSNAISMALRLSIPAQTQAQKQALASGKQNVIAEPVYGTQLQEFAILGQTAEGKIKITYDTITVTLDDGEQVELRQPHYQATQLGFGPLHPDTMLSARVAPPMIGLGLLEAIDEQDLIDNADANDDDNDGISGRLNRVWSRTQAKVLPGRYGWKAGHASIDDQNQQAFNDDIGLSTPLYPAGFGECTSQQQACRQAPDGNSQQYDNLEVHQQLTDLVLLYVRNLAVPATRNHDDLEVQQGRQLFTAAGCSTCHRPEYVTRPDYVETHLANRTIRPYTDLLLHDMGEGLADHRPEAQASGREWKTPPLWGIGLTQSVSGHSNLLHDGRARNIQEAILWHGGEAQRSKEHYTRLPRQQRSQLIKFVESL
ncbi:MAG: di-heme oxidoredictase family protein [Chromatiales bacterium]